MGDIEDLKGRAKEAAGNLTENERLEREGKLDQASAGIKDKVDTAKDKLNDVADKAKNKLDDMKDRR